MTDREQQLEDRVLALEKGQEEVLALLRPIAETYTTATNLGKWLVAAAVFLSIIIGIIIGLKDLIKR